MKPGANWLVAFLLAVSCGQSHADKKTELNQLRDRIETLQRDLAKSEESRVEVADALRTSEKAISEVNRGLLSLGREQVQISQSLADLKRKIDAGRTAASAQQGLLDRMIRYQYMHGNADALRLMLNGQDVADVERQIHYFGYVSKARITIITKLKLSLATLAELETTQPVRVYDPAIGNRFYRLPDIGANEQTFPGQATIFSWAAEAALKFPSRRQFQFSTQALKGTPDERVIRFTIYGLAIGLDALGTPFPAILTLFRKRFRQLIDQLRQSILIALEPADFLAILADVGLDLVEYPLPRHPLGLQCHARGLLCVRVCGEFVLCHSRGGLKFGKCRQALL